MNKKVKMNKGCFYRNYVWFSKAYQDLSISARDLLQCIWTEINKKEIKGEWISQRNGKLSFPYSQFKEMTGRSKQTYTNARNQLIKVGFIKCTKRGGSGKGNMSQYKVLFGITDMPKEDERWRKYPLETWSHEIKKYPKQLIGKKTRFQKGKSGRNLKSTLSELNLEKPERPNGFDPKT
ncbi:MAG: hypothetical protein HOM59_00525 [Candidatus Marinimicrobia bacterium]|jgi:hypothetical protein|nr:hypothetical protein [Candidatus Neomarinimicrobiota bacterium]